MKEEFEYLRKRAQKFHTYSRDAFEKGDYEIAAFNIEQALQLYLKYTLGILLGEFPRTHSISLLLENVAKVTGDNTFLEIIEDNPSVIANFEDVYITSRYLPSEFTKNQVAALLSLAEKVLVKLKPLWN